MNAKVVLDAMEERFVKIRRICPPVPMSTWPVEDRRPHDTQGDARPVQLGCGSDGVPPRLAPERQASSFALLKQRILLQLLDAVDDHASHNLIINEANTTARLASATGFPLLVFPCLFQEMAADVLSRDRRQKSAYWCGIASPQHHPALGPFETASRRQNFTATDTCNRSQS